MAVLFTRGKQTAKRFGLVIFEKSYYPKLCFLFFFKAMKTMAHIIICKPMTLYLVC